MTELGLTWRPLSGEEENRAWNRFNAQFRFRPSIQEAPAILEPTPSVTWDISPAFLDPDPTLRTTNREVNAKFLRAFRAGRYPSLLVLDWQHQCYEFLLHDEAAALAPELWPIPVIPDGDYYIFLSPAFDYGSFGHPWEETLCVFGQELLAVIEQDPPTQFGSLIRRNGHKIPEVG